MRLMPPRYVKPYLKRQKNDAADAEAICEAVTRPSMRFVEIKTSEQQSPSSCTRHLLHAPANRSDRTQSAAIWLSLASLRLSAAMVSSG